MPTNILRATPARTTLAAILIAAAVVVAGLASRSSNAKRLEESAAARAVPTVALVPPSSSAAGLLELPARVEPWSRAPIYARVSGYLRGWEVDIGTPVKAGQLLATIETPELDQQLLQAQAELATARSNLALAESTERRWTSLVAEDAVSRQEVDEKSGDLASRRAQVQGLQANLQRMQALKQYARLVAPFDGVVTARNTDVGALINVGGAPGTELFVVSDIRRLRVYAQVPQRQLGAVRTGSSAQINVPERPGKNYTATVQSLARAINVASGAMLVQLDVDNASGELIPGAFATVRFETPAGEMLSLPPSALIFGKDGVRVATIDAANRARIRQVTIARDLGMTVLIGSGVERGERIIDNPPDGIANGDAVQLAAADKKVGP
jgi:RND family efflux transporter MFP subunit